MTIVPMAQLHIDAITALEQICFSEPWSAAALTEELANPLAVFLVAMEGDTLLGYVGMHHVLDEGFITNVAVSPEARRRGVARGLLAQLAAYGREHSLYRITLEVRVSNAPARTLYEAEGYKLDGIRPKFYSHPAEDAAIYSLYFQ